MTSLLQQEHLHHSLVFRLGWCVFLLFAHINIVPETQGDIGLAVDYGWIVCLSVYCEVYILIF